MTDDQPKAQEKDGIVADLQQRIAAAEAGSQWIVYFDGGVDAFETLKDAVAAAEDSIIDCMENGEWEEAVESILVAKVTHKVKCFPQPVGPDGHLQLFDYKLVAEGDQDGGE